MAEKISVDEDIIEIIRMNSLCGNCKSSTLIGWPIEVDRDDLPRSIEKDRETDHWYLIRCDYFKITVSQPQELAFCEAYKKGKLKGLDSS